MKALYPLASMLVALGIVFLFFDDTRAIGPVLLAAGALVSVLGRSYLRKKRPGETYR